MIEDVILSAPEGHSHDVEQAPVESPPDAATPANDEAPVSRFRKSPSFYGAFLSLVIMVLLVSLDSTGLAVAIPVLTSQLGGTTLEAFWANISFMLAVVVTQPLYVSASDILGRKPLLYAAFLLFGAGSVVFAAAPSMGVVILGRLVQGLGGGGLDVLNEVLICDITTLRERPLWLGLIAVPMAVGVISGPLLGAALSEYVSWRWIGWINLPLLALSALLAVICMRLKPMEGTLRSRLARLDGIGMGVFTVGCTMFSLPMSWAGSLYPWSSWRTIVPLVVGVAVLVGFCVYEARPSDPVFPYRFFKSRTLVATLVGSFLHGLVLYPLMTYMALFFQSVYLQNPWQSAISILPLGCLLIGFSFISGIVVDTFRRYRWLLWASWIAIAAGCGLFSLWDPEYSRGKSVGLQVLAGAGLGVHFTVPALAIQASVEKAEDQGLAVGILVTFRLFGALIGLAIASTTFSSAFGRSIASLGQLPHELAILQDPNQAIGFIPYLRDVNVPNDLLEAVRTVYDDSMRPIWYIMVAFSGLGFLSSLLVKEQSLESEEVGRQHYEEKN